MEDKKRDIQQRKTVVQSNMAMAQQQPQPPGMPGVQPGMQQPLMGQQQQGMPPNQQPLMPNQQGMLQHQQGMPPSQPGLPQNQHGMGPNQSAMPPNSMGMNHQGMPPNQQGMPPNQQGMPPNQQGMPPNQQGMGGQGMMSQNKGQMRMGGPMGMRQSNPQRMDGPGGQRMRFPQNDNMRMQNSQQIRMGGPGPRGQIRMVSDEQPKGGMNQNQSGFGGPRQRFPGGQGFNNMQNQNQMNRMPGPRGPLMRGPRPMTPENQFRQQSMYGEEEGQGDNFQEEGGEEDMCLEDDSENSFQSSADNPFRRPEIVQMMANDEDEEEFPEENMDGNMMGGPNQFNRMQNMNMRGGNGNNRILRGPSPNNNMQMRGNFQNRGNPRGMGGGGPRGAMSNPNQMKPLMNAPQRMPLKGGPISLMDIRFDKPPAPKVTIDENEQKSDEQDKGYVFTLKDSS